MDWRRLARLRRRPDVHAEAPELDQLLAAALRASTPIQRIEWTRSALRWIEKDLREPGDSEGITRAHARLRFLLQMVDRATDGGRAVRAVLSGLLLDIDLEQLTAAGGIPRRAGFLKELYERGLAAILPQPDYRAEPALLAGALLGRANTMTWIDVLPSEEARRLARHFMVPGSEDRIDPQLAAAMLTLASEAQAVALASDMRRRFANSSALQSPFGQLVSAVEAFLASRDPVSRDELQRVVDDATASKVHAGAPTGGATTSPAWRATSAWESCSA